MEFDEFISISKPLDIILVRGSTPFSKLIEKGSEISRGYGEFSHCGLIINKDICPDVNSSDENLLIMEVTVSALDNVTSIETGKYSFGCQIRDMHDMIKEHLDNGHEVALCKLKNNPYLNSLEEKNNTELTRLRNILNEVHTSYITHKSIYDPNIFSLLGTIFPSMRGLRDVTEEATEFIRKKHQWVFCSEFICVVYRDIGLLLPDTDVQAYLPVDFVNPGSYNEVNSIMQLPPIFCKAIQQIDSKKESVCAKIMRAIWEKKIF